jgi:hypothetical protein
VGDLVKGILADNIVVPCLVAGEVARANHIDLVELMGDVGPWARVIGLRYPRRQAQGGQLKPARSRRRSMVRGVGKGDRPKPSNSCRIVAAPNRL